MSKGEGFSSEYVPNGGFDGSFETGASLPSGEFPETPEAQLARLEREVAALTKNTLALENLQVIGTLTRQAEEAGINVKPALDEIFKPK